MTPALLLVLGTAHARTTPALVAPDLVVGSSVVVHFYGGLPGETAYLAGGTGIGVGPCPAALGGQCLDLLGARLVDTAVTDADGHATFMVQVPAGATPGTSVALQVAVPRGVGGADSLVTEALATALVAGGAWYADLDGDGFGDVGTAAVQARPPAGYVGDPGDCDDAAPTVHPGAPEILGDAIDQDCDGDTVPRIPCTGAPVPGAYATIQDAVTALQNVGGTICVGEGTFTGDLLVEANQPLEIVGVSREHTRISGVVDLDGTPTRLVRLAGMTLSEGVLVRDGLFALEDLTVRSSTAIATQSSYNLTIAIDRCDLEGSISMSTSGGSYPHLDLDVRNSVLSSSTHDALRVYSNHGLYGTCSVSIAGSTVIGQGAGSGVAVLGTGTTGVTMRNNLITGFAVGTELGSATVVSNSGYNAYWDNGAAYGQYAVPLVGDVFADCHLDGLWPPAPAPGSACIDGGRGGAGLASDEDFWGRRRDTRPDIGAVEW